MNTRGFIVTAIFILLLLAGCSTIQVSQDFRYGTDFSNFRTYQWQQTRYQDSDDIRINNPLLHERFQQAIERTLGARGYSPNPSSDIRVSYDYSIATRLESDPFYGNFGYGHRGRHRYGGIGFGTGGEFRQYDVGILVIDIQEVSSGRLIWRGTGSEIVRTHRTPQAAESFAYRMVDAVLAQFPPQ